MRNFNNTTKKLSSEGIQSKRLVWNERRNYNYKFNTQYFS